MHFHEHSPDEWKNRRIEETVSTFSDVEISSAQGVKCTERYCQFTLRSEHAFSTYKTRTFCGCAALKVVSLNTSGPVTTKATTMFRSQR